MSTIKTKRTQIGTSATATNNFTLTAEAADGTIKIARGNAGSTTQDILTIDSSNNIKLGASNATFTDNTGVLTSTRYTGIKNQVINGNFNVWQRGTTHSTLGYGSADRWYNAINNSANVISQQAFTIGQTAVPNNPKYFIRNTVTSVAAIGNYAILSQHIEDVTKLAGKTITVSFWAKADASKNMSVEFIQSFGTGGSPSADVTSIGVTKQALTTSWQKITVTATLPSVSGKTLGSNNDDCLVIAFWFDAGSTHDARTSTLGQQSGTFDIAQVQIEEGSAATSFESRPYSVEFQLCQRYYQVMETNFYMLGHAISASSSTTNTTLLPVRMRAAPTVTPVATPTLTGGTAGAITWVNTDSSIKLTAAGTYTTLNVTQWVFASGATISSEI